MKTGSRVIAALVCLLVLGGAALAKDAADGVRGKLEKRNKEANRAFQRASLLAEGADGAVELATLEKGEWLTVFPEKSNPQYYYVHVHGLPAEKSYGWVHRSTIRLFKGPFEDVPADHWARKALERLKDKRLLEGDQENRFLGEKPFTRYEMAVVLDRYLQKLELARKNIMAAMETVPLRANLSSAQAAQLDKLVASLAQVESLRKTTGERLERLDEQARKHEKTLARHGASIARNKAALRKVRTLAERNARLLEEARSIGDSMASAATNKSDALNPNVLGALAENVVSIKHLGGKIQGLADKVDNIEKERALAGLLLRDSSSRALLKQVYRDTKVLKKRLEAIEDGETERAQGPVSTDDGAALGTARHEQRAARPVRDARERISSKLAPSTSDPDEDFSIASLSERIARKLIDQRQSERKVGSGPVAGEDDDSRDDLAQLRDRHRPRSDRPSSSKAVPAADTAFEVVSRDLAEKESTIRAMIEAPDGDEDDDGGILGPTGRASESVAKADVLPPDAYRRRGGDDGLEGGDRDEGQDSTGFSKGFKSKLSTGFSKGFKSKLSILLERARASRARREAEVTAMMAREALGGSALTPRSAHDDGLQRTAREIARALPAPPVPRAEPEGSARFAPAETGTKGEADDTLGQLSKQVLEISSNLRKIDEKLAEFEQDLL